MKALGAKRRAGKVTGALLLVALLPAGRLTAGGTGREAGDEIVTASSLRLAGGKVDVAVTYRNQYDGSTGEGVAVSLGDKAGYFSFFRPQRPEVVVKVLDFGPTTPFLLFVSSMSDFEQSITFTNLENGVTKTFDIPAGSTVRAHDASLQLFSTIDTKSLTR